MGGFSDHIGGASAERKKHRCLTNRDAIASLSLPEKAREDVAREHSAQAAHSKLSLRFEGCGDRNDIDGIAVQRSEQVGEKLRLQFNYSD